MNEDRPRKSLFTWLESLRLFSGDPKSRNEIKHILREAEERQLVDSDALSIMEGAIQVADMQVREIMIPRSQMAFVNADQKPKDFLPLIIESAHSRFPVLGENDDEVLGILLAKDLLGLVLEQDTDYFRIKEILRPVTFVPESKRLNVLLKEFRATRNHMAIVIDEYGGIAGLVTIEDVLEQIVGDIEDEHDFDEEDSFIKQVDDDTYMVKPLRQSKTLMKALVPPLKTSNSTPSAVSSWVNSVAFQTAMKPSSSANMNLKWSTVTAARSIYYKSQKPNKKNNLHGF